MQGRFLDVLISMYLNDKSAVKIDNKLTEAFSCFAGVKQGMGLSWGEAQAIAKGKTL